METSSLLPDWNSHIFPFSLETSLDGIVFYTRALCIKSLTEYITDIVGSLPDSSTFFWCEILQSLEDDGELACFPEDGVFVLDKRLFCLGEMGGVRGRWIEVVVVFEHRYRPWVAWWDDGIVVFDFSPATPRTTIGGEWILVLEADIVLADDRECLEEVFTIDSDEYLLVLLQIQRCWYYWHRPQCLLWRSR
jgi:hypothetical protein